MNEHFRLRENNGDDIICVTIFDLLREWNLDGCFTWTLAGTIEDQLKSIECPLPLTVSTITEKHYLKTCLTLEAGGAVISPGFKLSSDVRDSAGFCTPVALKGYQFYRGFTNNHRRPGILCQKACDLFLPRGNQKITLPSKTKVCLPLGSYFVDDVVFDEIMLGQTFYAVLPLGA